jgi:hypothetical protein
MATPQTAAPAGSKPLGIKATGPKPTKPAKAAKPVAQPKPPKAKVEKAAKAPRPKADPALRLVKADLTKYTKVKAASGAASAHCGDDIAAQLLGKTLDQVYAIAAKAIGVPEAELRAKYAHLNPGQARMNLGNRMRGAITKAATAAAKKEASKNVPPKPAKEVKTPAAKPVKK